MSTLRANTISDAAGTGPVTLTGQRAAKVWSKFNGTGTLTINDSFNVTSVTDGGTGDYDPQYTNNMATADYCSQVNSSINATGTTSRGNTSESRDYAVGSIQLWAMDAAGTPTDAAVVNHVVHGDLA